MSNFIGKDGYSWWVGVVENIDDPLKIGRCKVRIFGWHTENLAQWPTADLPWAQPKVNAAGDFTVPAPGDYVTGFFADGASAQNAYYDGILPGIRSTPWDRSKGFSPQPLEPGKVAEPNAPVTPPGVKANEIGQPTTVPIARGIVEGTGISITNKQLAHVCDFRYEFNFSLDIGITNPITAIQNAIKAGKNNSAKIIKFLIEKLNDGIRLAIRAIITALGFDPSGQMSGIYAIVKYKLQDINDYIEQVAEWVEIAATIKFLIQDINQIVTYLKSLPARFQAMVQDCIATFLNGAKAFAASVLAVPGQVAGTVEGLAAELQATADSVLGGMKSDLAGVSVPPSLSGLFAGEASADHADLITTYLSESYANTETTLAQANENNYDPTKAKWA